MKITDAIASNTPALGILTKVINNGDIFVKALITTALVDLVKSLNVGKSMNVPQIAETAELILIDFNALKIEDIRVCFTNGKKGHYGQLFDRLDGQIIMMWLSQYSTDRTNEFLRIKDFNEKQDILNIKKRDEILFTKPVLEALKNSIKNVDASKKIEKPFREKSAYEKLIQRFMTQFDKIWYKKDYEANGARFIFRYGKPITQVEYIEYKIKQHDRIMNLKLK